MFAHGISPVDVPTQGQARTRRFSQNTSSNGRRQKHGDAHTRISSTGRPLQESCPHRCPISIAQEPPPHLPIECALSHLSPVTYQQPHLSLSRDGLRSRLSQVSLSLCSRAFVSSSAAPSDGRNHPQQIISTTKHKSVHPPHERVKKERERRRQQQRRVSLPPTRKQHEDIHTC